MGCCNEVNINIKDGYRVRQIYDKGVPAVIVKGGELPDVDKTFDCGQCFRFERVSDSRHKSEWGGVAFGRYVSFANDGDELYIYNSTEREFEVIWSDFLDLRTDYGAVKKDILSRSDSTALRNAAEFGEGIRILRQDKWETLCSFIISQNNNIPRIKKIISALCGAMGDRIDTSNMTHHGAEGESFLFPDADTVCRNGVEALVDLRTGFRAKYIYDAAERVSSGALDLDGILKMPSEVGAERLCSIKGVGPKVAACTLLFGFGKHDAFPVDVWIKKVIKKYFSEHFEPCDLGAYAGIAQQYLFYYERFLGGE